TQKRARLAGKPPDPEAHPVYSEVHRELVAKRIDPMPRSNGNRAASGATDGVYLVRADTIKLEAVDYLDEPLVPLRVVTVVCGLDGVGKSTITYTKAADATRGLLDGKFAGEPVDVVIA